MQQAEESEKEKNIPEEFQKIMKDFIGDIVTTFPEYQPIINKWWNTDVTEENVRNLFTHCLNVFPERFMDILYQNTDMFSLTSTANTEFLPGISFKYLWNSDISEKTKETIMKYLQLILLSIVGSIRNKEAFGNTAKLFENIDETEFKGKLQDTLEKMQQMFESSSTTEETEKKEFDLGSLPTANDIHGHITGMMDGKLGQLAREIAEETAGEFNMDMENITDAKDVFQNLFKNPGKMANLVKNVGAKLESRMKSGDIKESELFEEAADLMKKMKNMPGMDNIQSILESFGGNIPGLGRHAKVDVNAMESQLARHKKMSETKERMRKNAEMKHMQKAAMELMNEQKAQLQLQNKAAPELTVDEILASLGPVSNNKAVKQLENGEGKKKKKKANK